MPVVADSGCGRGAGGISVRQRFAKVRQDRIPSCVQSARMYTRCESLHEHDFGLLRGVVLDVFQADQHQASDALGFAKAVRRLMVVPNPAPPTRARSTSRWSTKEMTSSAYCAQVCRAGRSEEPTSELHSLMRLSSA